MKAFPTINTINNHIHTESKSQDNPSGVEQIRERFMQVRGSRNEISVFTPKYTFWTSNDKHIIANIKIENQNSKNHLNLLVGESDVFSMLPELNGDIIICDVDRTLLHYIDETIIFLKDAYHQFLKHKCFKMMRLQCISYFEQYSNLINPHYYQQGSKSVANMIITRAYSLGRLHFLSSVQRFKECMESLSCKEVITIDVNLFDHKESQALANAIKSSNYRVNFCNLTNLPDYDKDEKLPRFLHALPLYEKSLIKWNIHYRGFFKQDACYDILFTAKTAEDYDRQYQSRPQFFGDFDIALYGKTKMNNQLLNFSLRSLSEKRYHHRKISIYIERITKIIEEDIIVDKRTIADEYQCSILQFLRTNHEIFTKRTYNPSLCYQTQPNRTYFTSDAMRSGNSFFNETNDNEHNPTVFEIPIGNDNKPKKAECCVSSEPSI